jgi:hypothetical protein
LVLIQLKQLEDGAQKNDKAEVRLHLPVVTEKAFDQVSSGVRSWQRAQ